MFQTTASDYSSDGKAEEIFVMTNGTSRASRLFRNRKVASFRLDLRKSRKVRLLIVGSQANETASIPWVGVSSTAKYKYTFTD